VARLVGKEVLSALCSSQVDRHPMARGGKRMPVLLVNGLTLWEGPHSVGGNLTCLMCGRGSGVTWCVSLCNTGDLGNALDATAPVGGCLLPQQLPDITQQPTFLPPLPYPPFLTGSYINSLILGWDMSERHACLACLPVINMSMLPAIACKPAPAHRGGGPPPLLLSFLL